MDCLEYFISEYERIWKRLFIVKHIPHLKGCLLQNTMVHYGVVYAQQYKGT